MDLTHTFQIGDRVRIVVDIFDNPYSLGSEWTITGIKHNSAHPGTWIGVEGFSFLIASDLELVERAS